MKLQIIVGSTRPTRAADMVTPWVTNRAALHEAFDTEVLDLRDWPLPMFGEHVGSIGDRTDPTYSDVRVRAWNRKIAEADAYLVVTPEYNDSIPGELKNAIDSVFVSFAFRNKPLAMVGYSGGVGGGIRAIEHLVQVAVEVEAAPLRSTVVLPFVDGSLMPTASRLTPRPRSACRSCSTTWPGGRLPSAMPGPQASSSPARCARGWRPRYPLPRP